MRHRFVGTCAASLLLLLLAESVSAHVPMLRGRLVDLVTRSELIVVGTVDAVQPVQPRQYATTVRIDRLIVGEAPDKTVTFSSVPRFVAGRRYVFFLHRSGADLECTQASGTVFPAHAEDDAVYVETIGAIQRALRADPAVRPVALRAALIPALSASAPGLPYYAVLDFEALAHHGISEPERRALERVTADPTTDPAVRPIVTDLLRSTD